MTFRTHHALAPLIGLLALSACGHSEEEWQAQLAKYNAEVAKVKAAQTEIGRLQQEIAAAKTRVAELEQQLEQMGLGLESKGKAVEELNASLAEMRKALEDYKARARVLEAIRARMLELRRKLDALTKLGLAVRIRRNRMIISLPGDILFDTGKTDLKKEGQEILIKVADVVRNDRTLLERDFMVTGHTDNKPLQGGVYQDNWGLSLMRAREVLVFLIAPREVPAKPVGGKKVEPGGGLPVQRWSAAGFGETDPIAANDTTENMQKNRRVELVVMPNVEEMLDLKSLTDVAK
jgi:chemotaxis protein MotB